MASLGYLLCVLISLLNTFSYFLHVDLSERCNYIKPAGNDDDNEVGYKALFVFGDSLFDPGNNQYIPNDSDPAIQWPYGETFFHRPTGRLSDGRIIPDFVAKLANLPMLPPYLQPDFHNFTNGVSFASAGDGVLVETLPGTLNLPKQLDFFKNVTKLLQKQLGDEEATKLLGTAVYLISIGGNDYYMFYDDYQENATEAQVKEIVGKVIGNLTAFVQGMYDLGGRKMAFQNVGPEGCSPYAKQAFDTNGCVKGLESLVRLHNKALAKMLKELESTLPGFKYSFIEFHDALVDRIINPNRYGFKDGANACCGVGTYRGSDCGGENGTVYYELCGNPEDNVYFDGAHPTEKANMQFAELFWSGGPNITWPYNMQQLFELA